MTTKSDDYEVFVQSVCQDLMGESGVEVYRLREYEGKKSQRKIKIDVSFETQIMGARILVICECKCYKSRVDVGEVQEFYAKIDDIGAQKGIMLTTVGYQSGAKKFAEGYGIALAVIGAEPTEGELYYVLRGDYPGRNEQTTQCFVEGNIRPGGRFSGESYALGFRFNSPDEMLRILAWSTLGQTAGREVD